MASRLWTPADMADGPRIWVDGEAQTEVQPNGVLTAVSALRGGPMSFSTGNFSDAAVLARGTDGRAWITAPEVAGFEPSGITYPEGSRFASWAYAKGILDGVACRAAEIFAVTRRNSSYTSTSTALMASVGGSSSVGGGALIMRRTPTRVTAQSVQPTASAYQNTDTDGPLLARCYVNEATGLIGTSISGQTPTETSYTPDPSGGSVPSSTTAWYSPRVGDTGYDGAEYLIFYRRLTADEAAQLEGYLAHKWGISGALPDAHPYRAAPPQVDEPAPPAPRPVEPGETADLLIRPAKGQTWGSLALRYYYDEAQMARLIAANPALAFLLVFTGEEEISVPIVAEDTLTAEADKTPPWRR